MTDPFVGEIRLFSFSRIPRGWTSCDGKLLQIEDYTALFSLLGTIYGGDGRVDFAVPDLRGRVSVSNGQGPGHALYRQGEKWGLETEVFMYETDLPPHTHDLMAIELPADSSDPKNNAFASRQRPLYVNQAPDTKMMVDTIASSGHGAACENRQPSLVLNYCIALDGVYPSRP
ncbi:MAG: phage tail protein [Anaerolineaceae bacterium]|nr:phage tail protein [Anaerolineaceae bacterium]